MVRIPGVDGTKAQCSSELPGLPDSLLCCHEAKRGPVEGEEGQIFLSNERLTVGGNSVEESERGCPNRPIDLGVGDNH